MPCHWLGWQPQTHMSSWTHSGISTPHWIFIQISCKPLQNTTNNSSQLFPRMVGKTSSYLGMFQFAPMKKPRRFQARAASQGLTPVPHKTSGARKPKILSRLTPTLFQGSERRASIHSWMLGGTPCHYFKSRKIKETDLDPEG